MFVVIGLGNPGARYAATRHNIGRMVVERLAALNGMSFSGRGGDVVEWARGRVAAKEVVIARPLVFMNLSGAAAGRLLKLFAVPLESMLVVLDDCDLPAGRVRIRKGGGSGGHRGLDSIIKGVGGRDFPRLRMGIGRPGAEADLSEYVLSPFLPEETELVESEIETGAAAIEAIIAGGIDCAMNLYNQTQGSRKERN